MHEAGIDLQPMARGLEKGLEVFCLGPASSNPGVEEYTENMHGIFYQHVIVLSNIEPNEILRTRESPKPMSKHLYQNLNAKVVPESSRNL